MTQTQSAAALDYPAAARSIALNLERFCDESLPYPEMIADAARKASAALVRAERASHLLDAIRKHCRVIFWPDPVGVAYPLEHNPHAQKDQWDEIVAQLTARAALQEG